MRRAIGFGITIALTVASAAAAAQPAPGGDCVPACRAGFLCSAGTCVSACNPPCAAGEACQSTGECTPAAAAPADQGWGTTPAPAPAPAPAQPAQPAQFGPEAGGGGDWATTEGTAEAEEEPSGLVLLPRLALLASGSGTRESECNGSLCYYDGASDKSDFDDASSPGIGFDLLYHLGPSFRIGGGFLYVFTNEVDPEDGDNYENGSDLSILAAAEGFIHLGGKAYLPIRGMLGIAMLIPGGDLQDYLDDLETQCDGAPGSCDVNTGPYVGFTYGLDVGFVYDFGSVALRIDIVGQGYSISADLQDASFYGETGTITSTVGGTRGWLMAGVEI